MTTGGATRAEGQGDGPRRSAPRLALWWGWLGTVIALAGCVTEPVAGPGGPARAGSPSAAASASGRRGRPAVDPAHLAPEVGQTVARGRQARVIAAVQSRGQVPYDDFALPLVSPDGQFIATQTGYPPAMETVDAEPGAPVPYTTRVQIFELPFGGTDDPRPVASVEEAVLLGRACNEEGFIVEAPRPGGSRWIGLASWVTGGVRWLVDDDDSVSAFATLGPEGRLAFSQRPVTGDRFDLVVRRGDDEWRLPAQDGDWLMPTWSCSRENPDGLFVLKLRHGALDLVHMTAESAPSLQRTLQRLPIAGADATVDTAVQTLIATVVTVGDLGPTRDQIFFFQPARRCAALWRPPGSGMLLVRDSLTAIADRADDDFALVSTRDELLHVYLPDLASRNRLVAGTQIPRATASDGRPYVLLQPRLGEIGVTLMEILVPKDAEAPPPTNAD